VTESSCQKFRTHGQTLFYHREKAPRGLSRREEEGKKKKEQERRSELLTLLAPLADDGVRQQAQDDQRQQQQGQRQGSARFSTPRAGRGRAPRHRRHVRAPQRVASSTLAYPGFLRVLGAAGDAPPRHITSARTRAARASARVGTLRFLARSLAHLGTGARYYYRNTYATTRYVYICTVFCDNRAHEDYRKRRATTGERARVIGIRSTGWRILDWGLPVDARF